PPTGPETGTPETGTAPETVTAPETGTQETGPGPGGPRRSRRPPRDRPRLADGAAAVPRRVRRVAVRPVPHARPRRASRRPRAAAAQRARADRVRAHGRGARPVRGRRVHRVARTRGADRCARRDRHRRGPDPDRAAGG